MTPDQFKQQVRIKIKTIKPHEIDWLKAFVNHWTEESKNGKRIRYDDEKFFDFRKRWATWKRNSEKWDKKATVLRPQNWQPPKEPTPEERARGRAKIEEIRRRLNIKKIG